MKKNLVLRASLHLAVEEIFLAGARVTKALTLISEPYNNIEAWQEHYNYASNSVEG